MLRSMLVAMSAFSLALTLALPIKLKAIDPAESYAVPEGGRVARSAYQNDYFGFHYPLPAGWVEDIQGPPPSAAGYYSLAALKTRDSLAATLLIAAQDNFFAMQHVKSPADFLEQMEQHLDPSLEPGTPIQLTIAGQPFARLDYAGAGLRHAVFATEIRCHTLIFSITSASLDQIETVAASLKRITFSNGDSRWPRCIQDYATADHIVHRVEPAAVGPRFSSVPARIVIGASGRVEQVHPIGGLPEQAKSIREALSHWEFKPYMVNGKPVAVETGLVLRFTAGQ